VSKRAWFIAGATSSTLVLLSLVVLFSFRAAIQKLVRHRTEAYLRARFQSDMEFKDFQVWVRPGVHVVVSGLALRHKGRTDAPPLIEIRKVSFDTSLPGILGEKVSIHSVRLEGLQIHTPPRKPGEKPLISATDEDLAKKYPVAIEEILADDAILEPLPKDPGKTSHPFFIHHLDLHNFRFDQPASFHALLTNPRPQGEIDCAGQFGPWRADEPSVTPVDAKFTFEHADLGTLKGLSGILSSKGQFKGPLDYLKVEGETNTPEFALRTTNHPVPLHTDYSAIVDGTNGDVILEKVIATLLNTTLRVRGEVIDLTTQKGRTIRLDAVLQKARVEDLLRLAVNTDKPAMTGYAKLKAKIDIPEKDEDLIERMRLDGQFGISDILFTNSEIQDKIDTLSHKGQGQPQRGPEGTELSELRGKFTMEKGVVKFSKLTFGVEGASLTMAGTYNMNSGKLDFRGKLRLDAKLSQTTTGMKSFFLKAVDPFFRGKDGGTVLPIKITGTKDQPKYGLDLHDNANKEPAPADSSSK
jgi:AsmA-like protein